MTYDIHPVAEMFPLIEGKAFDDLVADIKANGLRDPIEYQGNAILDGRNRLRACKEAGVTPEYKEIPSNVDPVKHIISRNIHRRHLTTAQRAAIAAELATMERGGDRGNQYTGGKRSNDLLASDALSIEQAADLMSVSAPSVKRAKTRMKEDPESHEAVKRGEKTKKPAEDSDMRNTSDRRLWTKIAIKAIESETGKMMGVGWIIKHLKPFLVERAPWLADCHPNKNISEDQASEVTRLTVEYARQCLVDSSCNEPRGISTFAKIDAASEEAAAAKQEVDATEKTKLERAIKAHQRLMDLQFEQRVKEHMEEILKLYADEYDRYKAFNEAYSGVFTDEEYRLLISVLHPDRCQPERAQQFAKAFHLVKSKEEVLCKVKPNDRPKSLPSSLEELVSRRNKH